MSTSTAPPSTDELLFYLSNLPCTVVFGLSSFALNSVVWKDIAREYDVVFAQEFKRTDDYFTVLAHVSPAAAAEAQNLLAGWDYIQQNKTYPVEAGLWRSPSEWLPRERIDQEIAKEQRLFFLDGLDPLKPDMTVVDFYTQSSTAHQEAWRRAKRDRARKGRPQTPSPPRTYPPRPSQRLTVGESAFPPTASGAERNGRQPAASGASSTGHALAEKDDGVVIGASAMQLDQDQLDVRREYATGGGSHGPAAATASEIVEHGPSSRREPAAASAGDEDAEMVDATELEKAVVETKASKTLPATQPRNGRSMTSSAALEPEPTGGRTSPLSERKAPSADARESREARATLDQERITQSSSMAPEPDTIDTISTTGNKTGEGGAVDETDHCSQLSLSDRDVESDVGDATAHVSSSNLGPAPDETDSQVTAASKGATQSLSNQRRIDANRTAGGKPSLLSRLGPAPTSASSHASGAGPSSSASPLASRFGGLPSPFEVKLGKKFSAAIIGVKNSSAWKSRHSVIWLNPSKCDGYGEGDVRNLINDSLSAKEISNLEGVWLDSIRSKKKTYSRLYLVFLAEVYKDEFDKSRWREVKEYLISRGIGYVAY